jgi:hypothetical protein
MATNTLEIKSKKHILEEHSMEGYASCSFEDDLLCDIETLLKEIVNHLRKARQKNSDQAEHFHSINEHLENGNLIRRL